MIIELTMQKQAIERVFEKLSNPTTGNTIPEEAKWLLFECAKGG